MQKSGTLNSYTNSINDCNTSLGEDAIHRVSTNGLFVTFFFQIGITLCVLARRHLLQRGFPAQRSGSSA
ncbi:hypothetical protein [Nostoc sp. UHCC 0302]|uniref:hypothetical protein n=1 Tax=Nostoc sp. UHCC 0302 TaxID=3134896 RepID=UPI00311CB4B8